MLCRAKLKVWPKQQPAMRRWLQLCAFAMATKVAIAKVAVEQVFSGSGLLLPQTSAISCCDGSQGRVLKKAEKDIFVAACKFCTAKQQNITAFTIYFLDFSLEK